MNSYCAYFFLAGIYIGGYTNLFSKLVISGLVLYIVHPDNFNPNRFYPLYQNVFNISHPYISKVYSLTSSKPKIEILDSPPKLPSINHLPPLGNLKRKK